MVSLFRKVNYFKWKSFYAHFIVCKIAINGKIFMSNERTRFQLFSIMMCDNCLFLVVSLVWWSRFAVKRPSQIKCLVIIRMTSIILYHLFISLYVDGGCSTLFICHLLLFAFLPLFFCNGKRLELQRNKKQRIEKWTDKKNYNWFSSLSFTLIRRFI